MSNDQQYEAYIKAAAALLRLPIESAWLPGVRNHLAVTLRLGELLAEFDLPDESEPAPIYRAAPDMAR